METFIGIVVGIVCYVGISTFLSIVFNPKPDHQEDDIILDETENFYND